MTKAIVTGGCGFIGSNLVDRLVAMGTDVYVIDSDLSKGHVNKRAKYFISDVSVKDNGYTKLFKGVDYVFHLAAEVRIPDCINNPVLAMQTNVIGTCNMLEESKKANAKRFLFSSTAAVYGLANQAPVKETMTPDCLNPYSVSKFCGEQLCKMYSELYGLQTVVFRYFNVYGKRQPSSGQYAPVIGVFNKQVASNSPITVIGDGEQTRDYVNVLDVVNANIGFARQTGKFHGDVFNIGTGKATSVSKLAKIIGGVDYETRNLPPRKGEVKHSVADIARAKSFGWNPQIKLEEWLNE